MKKRSSEMQITTKAKTSGRSITVDYNLGDVEGDPKQSVLNAMDLFTAEVVWANLRSEMATSIRDHIRPKLESEASDEDIIADLATYKIGVRTTRTKDPLEKIMSLLGKLPEDKRAAVLNLLKNT